MLQDKNFTVREYGDDMRKKNGRWIVAVLVLVLAGGFAWFASGDFSARQLEGRRKLGAVYMTLNNPFYEVIDEEIRRAAENHGDVLLSRDPALNVGRQVEEVRHLIEDGVSLIFINPVDWQNMEPALREAKNAGVPVIAIDTDVADASYVASTVVSDNYNAGVQCAEDLLHRLPGGKIALLQHSQARSSIDRMQGFKDTIASHDAFEIVAEAECLGQLEIAMPAMEEILADHEQIDVVMALNDPAAMGAVAALKNAGKSGDCLVYGVDGVPEVKEMILAGSLTATAGQSPRQIGRLAAEQAYRILSGEKAETLIKLPTRLLTKETIDRNNSQGWD